MRDRVLRIIAVGVAVDRAARGGSFVLTAELGRTSLGDIHAFAEDFDLGQLQEALLTRGFDADVFGGERRGVRRRQELRADCGDDEVAAGGEGLQTQSGQLSGVQG